MWNPKNWLLLGLGAAILALGIGWGAEALESADKDAAIARFEEIVKRNALEIASLNTVIEEMKKNLAAARNTAAEHKRIAAQTQGLLNELLESRGEPCEARRSTHASVAYRATVLFNDGGVVRGKVVHPDAAPTGDQAVLPPAGEAQAGQPDEVVVDILVENYVRLIDYVLKLEETLKCQQE